MQSSMRVQRLRGLGLTVLPAAVVLALFQLLGSPAAQLAVLRSANEPTADPITVLLAAMTLGAELVGFYLVAVVALRLAAWLPGAPGRLAGRWSRMLTVPIVRRALDAALGGILLTQVALGPAAAHAAEPSTSPCPPPGRPAATAVVRVGPPALAVVTNDASADCSPTAVTVDQATASTPADPSPTTRTPQVPLPSWAGGYPSHEQPEPDVPSQGTGRVHTVHRGDTLWDIAAAHLPTGTAKSNAAIEAYWRQIWHVNRAVVGADPDLIFPGAKLEIPTYRPDPR
jgi:resuscitation-promoting factor RpfA